MQPGSPRQFCVKVVLEDLLILNLITDKYSTHQWIVCRWPWTAIWHYN